MEAAALLEALRARGASVRLVGSRLAVEPRRALDDQLREAIRAHRDELRALLQGEEGVISPPGSRVNTSTASPAAPAVYPTFDGDLVATKDRLGAVLIDSPRFGEVWIALDPCMVDELVAEEDANEEPRPVLLAEDVAQLRGKSQAEIASSLEVLRRFPGARVVS